MSFEAYKAGIKPNPDSNKGYILTITETSHLNSRARKVTEEVKYTSAQDLIKHTGRQKLWRTVEMIVGGAEALAGVPFAATNAFLGSSPEDSVIRGALFLTGGAVLGSTGLIAILNGGFALDKLYAVNEAIKKSHFRTIEEGFRENPSESAPIQN